MNGDFKEVFKRRSFYAGVFVVICAAGIISVAENRKTDDDEARQIKLAQESSKAPEPSKDVVSTYKPTDVFASTVPFGSADVESKSAGNTTDEPASEKPTTNSDDKKDTNKTREAMSNDVSAYSFDEEKGMEWPVKGDILVKFSTDVPVYFATTGTFKVSDGIVIASQEDEAVKCAADGVVTKIYSDDEHGNMMDISIGDGYIVTYGQLTSIQAKEGDKVKQSQVIARVAKPTSYFSKEGSNIYMKVSENDKLVDPMLLLK